MSMRLLRDYLQVGSLRVEVARERWKPNEVRYYWLGAYSMWLDPRGFGVILRPFLLLSILYHPGPMCGSSAYYAGSKYFLFVCLAGAGIQRIMSSKRDIEWNPSPIYFTKIVHSARALTTVFLATACSYVLTPRGIFIFEGGLEWRYSNQ